MLPSDEITRQTSTFKITDESCYIGSKEAITDGLKLFYNNLNEGNYRAAKDYYETILLIINKWPNNKVIKLLQALIALAEYTHNNHTTEQAILGIKQYLEEAILRILPKVAPLEQIDFYQKIAKLFLAHSLIDTAIHCYSMALNIAEANQISMPELINYLQQIEINLRYQHAKPLLLANLCSIKSNIEAVYKRWQQIKPLLAALRYCDPNEYQKLFNKFNTPLRLYAEDYLFTSLDNELERRILLTNRVAILLKQAKILIREHTDEYNAIVSAWTKKILSIEELSEDSRNPWYPFINKCLTVMPSTPKLNQAAISSKYRIELNNLRLKFTAHLKLNKPILKLQQAYTREVILMLESIAKEASAWLGEPPCAYSWIGIGSIAKGSLSPYSDLDCAILIADEQYKTHPYFTSWILSIDTILKTMAEPWEYANQTSICRGLHIDVGDLQRMIFNPEHNQDANKQVLINTPEKLAEFVVNIGLKSEITEHTRQTLAFSLLKPCLLYSFTRSTRSQDTNDLLAEYQSYIYTALEQDNLAISFWNGIIQYNLKNSSASNSQALDIKLKYINPLVHLCSIAAAYYKFFTEQQSLQDILKALTNCWHTDYVKALQNSLAYLYKLRAKQHFSYNRQYDFIGAMPDTWQKLELATLTPWQGLIDLNYEFKPDINFHPVLEYARLFTEYLNLAETNTIAADTLNLAIQQGCNILVQLPDSDLYKLYLKLSKLEHKRLIIHAMTMRNTEPQLIQLYSSLPNPFGISLNKEELAKSWQNTLLAFTEEYNPRQKQSYIDNKRVVLEWISVENNAAVKIRRLFPSRYKIDNNEFNYFTSDGQFNITELKVNKLLVPEGRRKVIKLYSEQQLIAYAKIYPESPGGQLQADLLSQAISGVDFHTTLIKCIPLTNPINSYPVLLSQAMLNSLQSYIDQGEDLTTIEKQLDPFYFSLKVFETLMLSPEDDKADNIALACSYSNKYRLISIDADHAFYPALVKRSSMLGTEEKVQLKSMVFCFKQMQEAIHPDAIALFNSFKSYELLEQFLNELDHYESTSLFTQEEIQYFLGHKETTTTCWIPATFEPGIIAKLYERIHRIQAALQDTNNPAVNHLRLLERIEPSISSYYLSLHQGQHTSPQARFDSLQQYTDYTLVANPETGLIERQSMLGAKQVAKRSLTIVNAKTAEQRHQDLQQGIYNTPSLALQRELNGIHWQYQQITSLAKELEIANTRNFVIAYPFVQEQVLKRIDFVKIYYDTSNQAVTQLTFTRAILNSLHIGLRELHLKNCIKLGYASLGKIIANNQDLRILNLSGCQNLEDDFWGIGNVLSQLLHLEVLDLSNTKVKAVAIRRIGWETLNLLQLRRLILQNCMHLHTLEINCPLLERFIINSYELPNEQIIRFIHTTPKLQQLNLGENSPIHLEDILTVKLPSLEVLSFALSDSNLATTRTCFNRIQLEYPLLKSINLYNVSILAASLIEHSEAVYCVAKISATQIVSSSGDRSIKLWDLETERCIKTLKGHNGAVYCVAKISATQIISGSRDHSIKLWDLETGRCIKTLEGHNDAVKCVAKISASQIISSSRDHSIKLWDLETGNCVKTLKGHGGRVNCVAKISASQIISGSDDKSIKLWNLETKSCIKTLTEHSGWVCCVAKISRTRIVSGSYDNSIKLWDLETSSCIKTLIGHNSYVLCVAKISATQIMSCSRDGSIKLWDLATSSCIKTLKEHSSYVYCVAKISATQIISSSKDSSIKLWNLNTTLEIGLWSTIDELVIDGLYVYWNTPDLAARNNLQACIHFLEGMDLIGEQQAKCQDENSLQEFLLIVFGGGLDAAGLIELNLKLPYLHHLTIKNNASIKSIAGSFTLLEHLELSVSNNIFPESILEILQQASGLQYLNLGTNYKISLENILTAKLSSLEYLNLAITDNNISATRACLDRIQLEYPSLKSLNLYNSGMLAASLVGHTDVVTCVAKISATQIISGSRDRSIKLWDLNSGSCIKTLTGHNSYVLCVAKISSTRIISSSNDDSIKLWDLETGNCVKTLKGHSGWVNCVAKISASQIISGSDDKSIKLWDLETKSCIKTLTEHSEWVCCVAKISRTRIVSGSADNSIKLWNLETGSCIKTLTGHNNYVLCVVKISRTRIVSGSWDKSIKLWDLDSGSCIKTLTGHSDWICCLAKISSTRIISSSNDNSIKLWDLEAGSCIKTLKEHTNVVTCIAKISDTQIISSLADNSIKIWNLNIILEISLWRSIERIEINDLYIRWNTPNLEARNNLQACVRFLEGIHLIGEQRAKCRDETSLREFLLIVFGGKMLSSTAVELNLRLPQLYSLIVKNCSFISSITGNFSSLEHLDLSGSYNLLDSSIFNILRSATRLQQIHINYRPLLHFFNSASKELTDVLFSLLSIRDLKSFGATSKMCYMLQQEFESLNVSAEYAIENIANTTTHATNSRNLLYSYNASSQTETSLQLHTESEDSRRREGKQEIKYKQ